MAPPFDLCFSQFMCHDWESKLRYLILSLVRPSFHDAFRDIKPRQIVKEMSSLSHSQVLAGFQAWTLVQQHAALLPTHNGHCLGLWGHTKCIGTNYSPMSRQYMLTPKLTRNVTQFMCPLADARWSAVLPKWSLRSGSPPRPTRRRRASRLPSKAAQLKRGSKTSVTHLCQFLNSRDRKLLFSQDYCSQIFDTTTRSETCWSITPVPIPVHHANFGERVRATHFWAREREQIVKNYIKVCLLVPIFKLVAL